MLEPNTPKEIIEVLQAFIDGKPIEWAYRYDVITRWYDIISKNGDEIKWDFDKYKFRVKVQPIEFWMNVYEKDFGARFLTKEMAIVNIVQSSDLRGKYLRTAHFKEVL